MGALIGLLILAYGIFFVGFFLYKVSLGRNILLTAVPFTAVSDSASLRVLVVGDSTGVGTGVADPKDSVAGRLAGYLGDITLTNVSRNGAKMEEVASQLRVFSEEKTFDLILIQAGGNDILQFTNISRLRKHTGEVLREAQIRGKHVVFMSTGDVGTAPLFLPPVSLLYDRRTRAAREVFIEAAREANVTYVDLFKEPKDEPFSKDPKRFYSADGLHPSGEGYALWFEQLKAALPALSGSGGA